MLCLWSEGNGENRGWSDMSDTLLSASVLSSFVQQQPNGCFYFENAWLDLITRLYGYSLIPLTTTCTTEHMSGFLPVCLMRSPLTGKRLDSLPFSDLCPLL